MREFHWNYRLYRLTVRTEASQALNPGSIPGRVTSVFYLPKIQNSVTISAYGKRTD